MIMKNLRIKQWMLGAAVSAAVVMTTCGSAAAEEDLSYTADAADAAEEDLSYTADAADAAEEDLSFTPATIAAVETLDFAEMFSDKDRDDSWDAAEAAVIELKGTSAEAEGEGVTVGGTTVTITEAGTYVLSGELEDGQIRVEADEAEKVHLVLNGVSITNDDSACIFVSSADKVIITLADGTENTLADTGTEYIQTDDGSAVDGVIFSRDDLTLNGSGSLTVRAGYKHGIVGKDDLVFTGGTYMVTAAGKGIAGDDSLRIRDGSFTVTAEDDALHSDTSDKEGKGYIYIEDGVFTLQSGDDGIHAATALVIAGGTITVEESYEGLEGATIDILDGDIRVTARDDALNAAYSSADSYEKWNEQYDFGGFSREEWEREDAFDDYADEEWGEWDDYAGLSDEEWDGQVDYGENFDEEWDGQDDYGEGFDEEWDEQYDSGEYSEEEWELIREMMEEYGDKPESGQDQTPFSAQTAPSDRGGRKNRMPYGRDSSAEDRESMAFSDWDEDMAGMTPPGWSEDSEGMMQPGMGGSMHHPGMNGNGGAGGFGGMMDAQEDAYLRIAGGTVYVNAGGDGLDANGYIYIEGGTVTVDGPADTGNSAMDYGIDAVISGGTFTAAGSAGMAAGFGSSSTQYSVSYTFSSTVSGGTEVVLKDADGNAVVSAVPAKDYQNVIFSTPDLQDGNYTVTAGGQTGEITVSGISARGGDQNGFSMLDSRI